MIVIQAERNMEDNDSIVSTRKRQVQVLPVRLHRGVHDLRVHSKPGRVKTELEEGMRVHVPVFLSANLQLEQVGEDILWEKIFDRYRRRTHVTGG